MSSTTSSLQDSYNPYKETGGRWYKVFIESDGVNQITVTNDTDFILVNNPTNENVLLRNIVVLDVFFDPHLINSEEAHLSPYLGSYRTYTNNKEKYFRVDLPSLLSYDYLTLWVFGYPMRY